MMCFIPYRRNVVSSHHNKLLGFTLVEVAIVLLVIGLLLGGILGPLSSQSEQRRIKQTESLLNEIHDALLGFATLNGYLPCPASDSSNGLELRDDGTTDSTVDCDDEHGLIPSNSLGLRGPFDTETGVVVDAWGTPVRYSLTDVNSWEYAKGIDTSADVLPFRVCRDSACAATDILVNGVVAIVHSYGPNGDGTFGSPDEQENTDNDDDFVLAQESAVAGSEFDDVIIWLSPNTLILRMVQSGQVGN